MAFLIPDNLRSRTDVPDVIRRVCAALQVALDDDVTVWYEPLFDPSEQQPHLVVLEPRVGVIVMEVLHGKDKASILGSLRGKLRVEIDGTEREVDDPLIRAETLARALRAQIAKSAVTSAVPVGHAAVLPHIARDDAERLGLGNLMDLDFCIFKPDVDVGLNDGDPGPILRVLHRATPVGIDREIDATGLDALRGCIHPDVVITQSTGQGSLFTTGSRGGTNALKVMDRRQEALAKTLGTGHRVIRGVAGSGKTLVLVHRARLLARLLPTKRILVTCYTRALAGQLRALLADFDNVDVLNVDKLMAREIRRAGGTHPGYNGGSAPVTKSALDAIRGNGGGKYQAVLVDEAQDFDTDSLRFCVELLDATEPDKQDLVIVADSAQNIFRKDFVWKDAGIKAQGRTRILRVNYRNTREILDFAHGFLTLDSSISIDDASDDAAELTIIAAESAERFGPRPTVTVVEDLAEEVEVIAATVRDMRAERAPSRSIAVLYGERSDHTDRQPRAIIHALREAGELVFWANDPDQDGNRDRVGSADEPVIVSTIASAKGLEFPKVIVCGLGGGSDLTTARKVLYVGFTRAMDELSVVVTSDSPFAADAQTALA